MKGILMAGGKGTRLFPSTSGLNKHLLPVFDKPMIYYPLSVFMLAGIQNIMLICNQRDYTAYQDTLGNGDRFGLHLVYAIQEHPRGIGEAFSIAKNFIKDDSVCLLLGDNIFVSNKLTQILQKCVLLKKGGILF
ncbi:sugar phosphate nucleotidyltransferase, partial [Liquorilactobacillus satsumensis]|uniref:sugar phosphate nucleotidyltransferase n=1 Tax=Liquorilactobacillus satsumensis TaxID=259059 RepID=UPI0039EA09A8